MRSISPSLLKEYSICPRAFLFRKIYHFSLIPSPETIQNIVFQERIDELTLGFYSTLQNNFTERKFPDKRLDFEFLLRTNFFTYLEAYTRPEDQIYRELDEKVFSVLVWLIRHFWGKFQTDKKQVSYFLPIMVNQFIQAPELNLQGRPSAVFLYPDNSSMILIQTFRSDSQNENDFVRLQSTLYARILDYMGIKAQDYLYVNFSSMNMKFHKFLPSDFKTLDRYLYNFQTSIEERNFDPPNNPSCEKCEFNLICYN